MIKVSVIIPCYNSASFLHAAINSVFVQTLQELELICINDGSSDETLRLLHRLKEEADERIPFVIIDQPNGGACAARNAGLNMARGEYVQFLDADDVLLPEKIKRQYHMAADAGLPEIVVGSFHRIDEQGNVILERKYSAESAAAIPELLMNTNLGITSSNLFRRDAVIGVKGWNESLKSSQEYDLMFRLIERGGKIIFDEALHTRILDRRSGSISRSNRGENWQRYVELRIRMLNFIRKSYPGRDLTEAYQAVFNGLRSLYVYDASRAVSLWKQHIPRDFRPQSGTVYRFLYGLLGMDMAERISGLFRSHN